MSDESYLIMVSTIPPTESQIEAFLERVAIKVADGIPAGEARFQAALGK